eukprot:5964017-Ditylum_brightwellii.AAC.1
MPYKATKTRAPSKKFAPKTNKKGDVTSWSVNSPDGKHLTILFEQDILKDHTADILKKEYKQFE